MSNFGAMQNEIYNAGLKGILPTFPVDFATLEKRVKDIATSTCKEIKVYVPAEGSTVDKCIEQAIDGATAQIQKAIEAEKAATK